MSRHPSVSPSTAPGQRPVAGRPVRFFVLTYLLTWAAWLPMLTDPDHLQPLHYLGSLGPLAAAMILTGQERGRAGIADLLRRMTHGPWKWLAAAAAFPFLLYGLGYLTSAALGTAPDLGAFLGSKEYAHVGWTLILIELVFFGFGEEVGWRGYALDALEAGGRRTTYTATTWLAIGWALWHLPLFFYVHGLATLSPLLVPGWLLSILFGSYLTTWLYRSSGNSLAVAAVFHAAVDLVSITPASNTLTLVTVNAGLIAAAVLVVIRYAPTLSARSK